MKYIGHLDLLKVFQSAIRRAKLPIAYSMGFNPHQRLSFALPLPVGMDSVCEYIEMLFDEVPLNEVPLDDIPNQLDRLNLLSGQLPEGLQILSVHHIHENAPRPAAAVVAADYRLICHGVLKEQVQALWDSSEILVMKKTKKGVAKSDIRPDILKLEFDPVGAVSMRLSAGSERNLNPTLVAKQLGTDFTIVRQELYGTAGGRLLPLHEAVIN